MLEAGVVQWLAHSTPSPGCGLSTGSIPGQEEKLSAGANLCAGSTPHADTRYLVVHPWER